METVAFCRAWNSRLQLHTSMTQAAMLTHSTGLRQGRTSVRRPRVAISVTTAISACLRSAVSGTTLPSASTMDTLLSSTHSLAPLL